MGAAVTSQRFRILVVGDALLPAVDIVPALQMAFPASEIVSGDWELDAAELDHAVFEMEQGKSCPYPTARVVREQLAAVDVLVVSCHPVSAEMIDHGRRLIAIGVCRFGLEHVALDAATACGVHVVRAAGRNINAVAEFTIGAMIAAGRGIAMANWRMRTGHSWPRDEHLRRGRELAHSTVGLVGFGRTGRAVASKLRPLGATIIVHDPYVDDRAVNEAGGHPSPLPELCAEADYLSIHTRLAAGQPPVLDRALIAALRPHCVVVNTARASAVDEEALREALRRDRIRGAALDVFAAEPPDDDNPWFDVPNAVLTPHLAGASQHMRRRSGEIIAHELQNLALGPFE